MIISASRRTDIPATYSEWFFNRLSEGFVLVRNPMNPHQVSKILLNKESVDCFVFWTKYPEKFIKDIDHLSGFKFYFQFTLNPYGKHVERGVPQKEKVIEIFKKLSDRIGSNRIIWRYDPIILNHGEFTMDYHLKSFERLQSQLRGFTKKCVISFFDDYKFASYNSKPLGLLSIQENQMREIAKGFVEISRGSDMKIETCAESVDLSDSGISHGKCIDNKMISEILGYDIEVEKDKTQREFCGCVKSVDIGSYSTCLNECLYCYATRSAAAAKECFRKHDPKSPLLFGELGKEDKVTERKGESFKVHQPSLFS
jgi:hypothetical protein